MGWLGSPAKVVPATSQQMLVLVEERGKNKEARLTTTSDEYACQYQCSTTDRLGVEAVEVTARRTCDEDEYLRSG